MVITCGFSASDARAGRRLLLGGWRDVVEDVRRLRADLARSPGVCTCGHAAGEPGLCPCCQTGVAQTVCNECGAQVSALRGKLATLIDDTLRFLPVIADLLERRGATQETAQLQSIRALIGTVDHTFRRLATATAEFRPGCRASHIKAVAALADDLLCEVWTLEEMLEPGTRRWTELQAIQRERSERVTNPVE